MMVGEFVSVHCNAGHQKFQDNLWTRKKPEGEHLSFHRMLIA